MYTVSTVSCKRTALKIIREKIADSSRSIRSINNIYMFASNSFYPCTFKLEQYGLPYKLVQGINGIKNKKYDTRFWKRGKQE
jgi:hypothetical protein